MTPADQQAEHFELLLEVGRLLSSKIELDELLTAVMQLAARVVNAETASLLLVDLATNELYFHVALGLDPMLAKLRLKMGQGIAGSVAQSASPLIINDVTKDPRWNSKMDKDSGFVTRSILAAPITLKGRCIGVVEAINHLDGDFSVTDLRIFEAFASQAAVAIENARLFASLKEQNQTLDRLLNEIRDAAFLTDGKGGVIVANAAARQFLGPAGGRLDDALAGLRLSPTLDELMRAREPLVAFEALRDKPQRLVLAGTASLIRDARSGDIKGRVVVFRDVTDERREEGLKRNFLSLISHKLKTPLASITGYSQLLYEDAAKKPEAAFQAKSLSTVINQSQKLSSLVDKLLNYTVLESLESQEIEKKPFDLSALLQKTVDALGGLASERQGKVTVTVAPGLSPVGDPGLVLEIMKNLVENGLKFSRAEAPEVTVGAALAGGRVEVRVADNGPGVPPEERAKIFEKFYQVDAAFTGQVEGWGLGLSFAKQVAQRLDGDVRYEPAAAPATGSVFVLTLPAADSWG